MQDTTHAPTATAPIVAAATHRAQEFDGRAGLRPWRLLLVDDHELIRLGVTTSCRDIGGAAVEWVEAATVDDALRACALQGPFDGVLLDLNLADSRGLQGLRQLRAAHPKLRVAIFSGTTDDFIVGQAKALGAIGHIPKSGETARMQQALAALVDPAHTWPGPRHATPVAAADARTRARMAELGPRQLEILELLLDGCSNQEISQSTGLALGTVKNHVSQLLLTLDVRSRAHLISLFR